MRKVVFLDRDGVINKERGDYTYRLEDFELNEGLVDALRKFNDSGYDLIVITNQGGIAKNIYSHEDVRNVHHYLMKHLKSRNVKLLDIFYCPHHDEISKCLCRKPGSLLLEKAIARYDIDITQSLMIGDRDRDIEAASKIGIRGAKVKSNQNLNDFEFPH